MNSSANLNIESLKFTGGEWGDKLFIWKYSGKPVIFRMAIADIDNIQMWVHEFSEHIIYEQIASIDDTLKDKTLRLLFNGLVGYAEIAHILVSLHSISGFGKKILTPEDFECLLPWRTKI